MANSCVIVCMCYGCSHLALIHISVRYCQLIVSFHVALGIKYRPRQHTVAGCEHQNQRKQKQQDRNSTQHMIIVYIHPLQFRSITVCIGVRTAILHRCSHLAFISPAGIGARTLPFTVRWSYRLALFRVVFLLSMLRSVKTTRRRNEDSGLARRRDGRET